MNPLNSEIFFKKLRKPLDAGVNRPVDGSQDALVFAVRFMVLHDKHQNVVDVDLHLPDEFNFERNIIVDVFFVPIRFRAIPPDKDRDTRSDNPENPAPGEVRARQTDQTRLRYF